MSQIAVWALDALIVLATAAGIGLVVTQTIEFGSERGHWVYRFVGQVDGRFVVLACGAGAITATMHELARCAVATRPGTVVAAAFAGGVVMQLALRSLYPYPMSDIVLSDVADGFYGAAGRVNPFTLLTDFDRVVAQLPLHARTNMPGKILFYQALRVVTSDPRALAVVVVLVSSAAGLVLYGIVARVFCSRALALDAMMLWMLVPAKVSLHPVLNVVSPLPALVAVASFVRLLDAPSVWNAVALGASTYLTAFFDPLALWLGVAFGPLAVRAFVLEPGRAGRMVWLLVFAGLVCLALHAAVRVGTGFDAWHRFLAMVELARTFNVVWSRPYGPWLHANAKDVALAVGPAVAVGFAAACGLALWRTGRALVTGAWRELIEPGALVTLAAIVVLGGLIALGMNRGEVARVWIPVFVPVLVAAAWCTGATHVLSRALLVAATTAYAAVTVATVGYAVP